MDLLCVDGEAANISEKLCFLDSHLMVSGKSVKVSPSATESGIIPIATFTVIRSQDGLPSFETLIDCCSNALIRKVSLYP